MKSSPIPSGKLVAPRLTAVRSFTRIHCWDCGQATLDGLSGVLGNVFALKIGCRECGFIAELHSKKSVDMCELQLRRNEFEAELYYRIERWVRDGEATPQIIYCHSKLDSSLNIKKPFRPKFTLIKGGGKNDSNESQSSEVEVCSQAQETCESEEKD